MTEFNRPETDPKWLAEARKYIGLKEIVGPKHDSRILNWWASISKPYKDDETPWCAGFVGAMLKLGGYPYLKTAWARSYAEYGVKLNEPAYGSIVVFKRDNGGHVGFVVGRDRLNNIMVLGGNQANAVNIKPFSTSRVIAYRWPGVYPYPERFKLPLLTSDGKLSTNEA